MLKSPLRGRPASVSPTVDNGLSAECPGFYLQTEMMQKGTEGAPGLGLHVHPLQEGADSSHGAGCAPGLQDSPFSGGWVTLEQGQARQGRALEAGEEEELS